MNSKSHQVIKRLIPVAAVWAVGKILETDRVQGALQEVDARAYVKKRNAARAMRRAGRNAVSNPAWLGAGGAAHAARDGPIATALQAKGHISSSTLERYS